MFALTEEPGTSYGRTVLARELMLPLIFEKSLADQDISEQSDKQI